MYVCVCIYIDRYIYIYIYTYTYIYIYIHTHIIRTIAFVSHTHTHLASSLAPAGSPLSGPAGVLVDLLEEPLLGGLGRGAAGHLPATSTRPISELSCLSTVGI